MQGHVAMFNELSASGSMLALSGLSGGYEVFDRERGVSVTVSSFRTALDLLICHLEEKGLKRSSVEVIFSTLKVAYELDCNG